MSDETVRLLNGEPADTLSLSDRGLAYGDGLFETILVREGHPCLLQRHLSRMQRGADVLRIPFPGVDRWTTDLQQVDISGQTGILKLTLTRGSGERGYAAPRSPTPVRILEFTRKAAAPPAPDGVDVIVCQSPLSENATLAGIKHLNRLDQVLAASEVRAAGAFEGVMRTSDGEMHCGTRSNILLRLKDGWLTPSLHRCGVAGIVREVAIELAEEQTEVMRIGRIRSTDLAQAEGMFLTNSLMGVVPVARCADRVFDPARWDSRFVSELRQRVTQA